MEETLNNSDVHGHLEWHLGHFDGGTCQCPINLIHDKIETYIRETRLQDFKVSIDSIKSGLYELGYPLWIYAGQTWTTVSESKYWKLKCINEPQIAESLVEFLKTNPDLATVIAVEKSKFLEACEDGQMRIMSDGSCGRSFEFQNKQFVIKWELRDIVSPENLKYYFKDGKADFLVIKELDAV
jgi:hypothetical protein